MNTPQMYFSKLGRCRGFLSQSDAAAYDVGYFNRQNYARMRPPYPGTPMRRGWDDAEEDQYALNAERAEQRRQHHEQKA